MTLLSLPRGTVTGIAATIAALFSLAAFGFTAYALDFLNPPGTWYVRIPSHEAALQMSSSLIASIPVYLLFVVPILLLDVSIKGMLGNRTLILASALVGPFAAFLDHFAHGVLGDDVISLIIVVGVMAIGGIAGGLLLVKLSDKLGPQLSRMKNAQQIVSEKAH